MLQVPQDPAQRTYYSLHAVGVRRGVPTSTILLDGVVGNLPQECTTEEILRALDAAVRQAML